MLFLRNSSEIEMFPSFPRITFDKDKDRVLPCNLIKALLCRY